MQLIFLLSFLSSTYLYVYISMLSRKQEHSQGQPVYLQIAEILRENIEKHYHANDCLPSEQELADRFSVNRHTLRRGIDELVSIGLVERVRGKGIFVLNKPVDYAINKNSRFTENLEALGKSSDTRLLRKMEIKADGNIARLLALDTSDAVLWIETLRIVDNRPFCLISHFLPLDRIGHSINKYQSGSLHAFIKAMGLKPVRVNSIVSATLPRGEDNSLLLMPKYLPVLRVKTINIDSESKLPIEYSVARFRSDYAQLSIDIC